MTNKTDIGIQSTKAHSKIIGMQFSILSPEEIRRNSVAEITSRDTYISNKPVIGGLFDPRMGILEPGLICPTDGLNYMQTPGYFGHLELARPVFFIQYLSTVIKICRCICFKCSKLLIDKEKHKNLLEINSKNRWDEVFNLASKIKRCGEENENGCGYKQPNKIRKEGLASIYADWSDLKDAENEGLKLRLTPEIILQMFQRITDDDINFMGFSSIWSRPEWMICQVLPVPPPAVRPSIKLDAQQRSEDDISNILVNIFKTNKGLQDKINANVNENIIDDYTTMLQFYVATMINNKLPGVDGPRIRTGRALKSIQERLGSKGGRVRGNLMGKRVDFSARSVITPDPNISIQELGVPLKIAMNITFPEKVTKLNKRFLQTLIMNGTDKYPGAKILETKYGQQISLKNVDKETIQLNIGDTVHRHMLAGDIVLFNRQPTLHRMSMMAHKVRIMYQGDTFRMNVGDTKPYNADFDGDEMNMHMPQDQESAYELRNLAAVRNQIISPANNSSIIGIFQDSLLGSFRFTRNNIKFTPLQAMNLLMCFKEINPSLFEDKLKSISNFEILSQIMPPISAKFANKLLNDNDDKNTSNNIIEIENGLYLRGQIEKSVFDSGSKGLIQRIFNAYSPTASANFIDDLQNIINEYMKTSAFSVGISDLIADKNTNDKIIDAITKKKQKVTELINQIKIGVFENNTGKTNEQEFESQVNNILNKAQEEAGKIGRESLDKNNRFVILVNAGSKGKALNIAQMVSCLGQQNVDGKRIPYGFENRTLPHFTKYDDTPEARGFVEDSFIQGLTPQELFFHAMGGRTGLIDTAVKTSQTGYIQRRLIKGLEDLKVEYDMTVRNNKGKIVQFAYGDDGFESSKVENQSLPLVGMSLEEIYIHYDIVGANDQKSEITQIFTKDAATRTRKQVKDTKEKCKSYIEKMIEYRDMVVESVFRNKNENGVNVPVAFQNTIANIQGQLQLNSNSIVDITPLEAFELIEEYFNKLKKFSYNTPTLLFEVLYYFYLTPKDLLINKRFHRKALVILLENIVLKYKQAIVHPGEMVGVIAGQSIGEPTTQLTLNTFHLSGVSSKSNVTRGVPRIEEILRLTKNPKNPSLTVYMNPNDEHDKDKASKYSNMLEHTKLIDVVKSVQICFDPNDKNTNLLDDKEMLEQFYEFEEMIDECSGEKASDAEQPKSKWIVRIEMDNEVLLDKNITMDDIHFAITNSHSDEISCVYSDYNSDNLVFRIRLNEKLLKGKKPLKGISDTLDQSDDIYLLRIFQDNLLNNIVLRGISGVENVLPRKLQNSVVKDDGKYTHKDIWIMDTTGSNLMQILSLDFIDATRTISNDIKEVFDTLGIEAARQIIYNELVEVMEFSGVYINYHHLSLLCDRMTSTENMVPIFRSGILNDDIGPISKSTFEVHTEVLLNASRHAEFDHMRGVSANVMMGQMGVFGTGAFQVVLDMEQMKNMPTVEVTKKDNNKEIEKMFGSLEDSSESCSKNSVTIKNNLDAIKKNDMGVCDDGYDAGF